MNLEKKRKLSRYLLIAQICIYLFIALHATLWYVFKVHALTKLCPFVFIEHLGHLEFNFNVLFWILIFGSVLFLGRAFCAWGCMFGAYQDFVSRLAKKLKIKPQNKSWVKWVVNGVIFLLISAYLFSNKSVWPSFYWFIAGVVIVGLIFWLLIEKKPKNQKLRTLPKYIFFALFLGEVIAMWITLSVFHKGITLAFDKYEVFYDMQWGLAVIAALVAFGILMGEKRIFCKYLCPIGLSLRFISAIPFPVKYKVRATGDCSKCGRCNKECFMGINPMEEIKEHGVVKDPNCINCLACVSKCPKNALDFTTAQNTAAIAKAENQKIIERDQNHGI